MTRLALLFVLAWGSVQAAPARDLDASARDPSRGEEIYNSICATCHESGVPKAPQKAMLSFMSTGAIYHTLTDGVMASRVPQLSDAEKLAVAEYITGIPYAGEDGPSFPYCEGGAASMDLDSPPKVSGWGVTYDNNRRFSPEIAGLEKADLDSLELKWVFGFPNAVRARSHPVVAAGAVFVGSQDGRVFALDKETGCVRWIYRARSEVRTAIVMSPWEKGDTNATPAVYFGDYLGNVYAVNALNGELIWHVRPDEHTNATITGAPTLYDGLLYVPVSSLEVLAAIEPSYECCTFRGSVVALDAASGNKVWQTYTIPEPPSVQGKNAAGVDRYGASGAPIWNSPAIDITRGQLLVGTGENYSAPASLTSDAIIAMDLKSGDINWVFQATPNDTWNAACEVEDQTNCPQTIGPDYDFGSPPMLVTASNGRDYVVAGQKSGIVWALNPEDGALIWKNQVSKGGINGGVHFGMAASGDRVFVPISDADAAKHHAYRVPNPGVFALDVKTGEYLWKWHAVTDVCGDREYCQPGNGGAITATDQFVFAGSLDGYFRIHDVVTGEVLWKYNTARDFESVNGIATQGGALEGGASAVVEDGMLFLNSGYFFNPYMPGNAFMAFGLKSDGSAEE